MAIERRDDTLTDAQGRALAGAQVYYCTQPANTATLPPSPLATVSSDTSGTPALNPQYTDGFGHAVAYLDDSVLYTVVFVHPLFGPNPVIWRDQVVPGIGGGAAYTPFAGVPAGTIDGANTVFTLTNGGTPIPNVAPLLATVWVNFPLIAGLGYSITGNQVTYAHAPIVGDAIYAQGFLSA